MFPLGHQPCLPGFTGKIQPGQKLAADQGNCRVQLRQTRRAARQLAMRVGLHRCQLLLELGEVNTDITARAQGDLFAVDGKPRRCRLVILEGIAQTSEAVAQVGKRVAVTSVGREQRGQCVAALGHTLLRGKVDEQDALGIGAKAGGAVADGYG